jgi:hypothetical protein
MKNWYSKEFPFPASVASKQVDDAFRELCAAQGGKANGAAIFSVHDQATNLITFFFSPEAKRLAEKVDAASCAKPTPVTKFALTIGDPKGWELHFPTFERTKVQTSSHGTPAPTPQRRR